MISSRAGKDPVPTPIAPPAAASLWPTPASTMRRFTGTLRAVRSATRSRAAVFTLCALSISGAATTAAVTATVQHLHAAQVQPLAPARRPPSAADATAATTPKHRHALLRRLAIANPLRGIASWYGAVLHGHTTASGEIFNEAEMTACHRTLPFGTVVRVTDTSSQRSVVVRINDRGVLNADRVIDLSSAAAQKLGILRSGIASVRLEIVKAATPAPAARSTESN